MTRALCLALLLLLTGCIVPIGHGGQWRPDPHWGDRGFRCF